MKHYRFLSLCIIFFILIVPVSAQDKDQDGFPDGQDACPFQAAPNSNNGCPPTQNNNPQPDNHPNDQDGDGTVDVLDQCPRDGGPAQNAGCPVTVTPQPSKPNDSDGDGFPDDQDACPNEAGSADGCDIAVIPEDGDCKAATKGTFNVNIRETATENGAIIGQLRPSETKLIQGITVSDNTPQNQSIWVKIDIGYIKTSVIRIGGDCGSIVSDGEGEPTMTGEFALEWDCSTTPRVIIISDETPAGLILTFSTWRVYPSTPYEVNPRPTEADYVTSGNIIFGTPCDDLIIGTHSSDIIDGLGGNDLIVGLGGADILIGNTGNDQLLAFSLPPLGVERFTNILIGGDGDDILNAAGLTERLDGGTGNDKLIGNGDDHLMGRDGDDILSSGTIANGGNGDDRITGTSGNDGLYGLAGSDRIIGGDGNDLITGGDGNDFLFGGLGNDRIDGGNNADLIQSGLGSDLITGGDSDDYILVYWDGLDIAKGQNGNDRIEVEPAHLSGDSFEVREANLQDPQIGSYFSGGNDNDIINIHVFCADVDLPIYGDNGNDRLSSACKMYGGSGDDYLFLLSNAEAHGGDGNDSFAVVSNALVVLMYGDAGNDNMIGNDGIDIMFGGDGNDYLLGGRQADYLNGGDGNDRIFGGFTSATDPDGTSYRDNANYIDSGSGRDTVDGGPGFIGVHENVCLVDASDSFTNCEIRSGSPTFWQRFFNSYGI